MGHKSQTEHHKFQIQSGSIQLLPAAIRLMDVQSDLFTRQVSDEQQFSNMLRGIKVLLRKDELRQSGKGDTLERFIAKLPQLSSLRQCDVLPAATRLRLGRLDPQQPVVAQLATTITENLDSATIGLSERELAYYHQAKKRLENTQLKHVRTVGLHPLPDQLWLAGSLNELQLIDCNLSKVPKQIENLASTLTTLDLSRNMIKELPRTFCCKMSRLVHLNLSHNVIETLPLEIKFLRQLRDFIISNNCLKMLPTTLSDLHGLKVLKVDSNKLSQLPAFRREDIRLYILDISHNPLDGALRHFSTFEIHASYNDDEYDPYTLSYMSSPLVSSSSKVKNKVPSLFDLSILNVVRSDDLFKLASEEHLPKTIVSTIQRDIFKCYRCSRLNILPAYNSTDTLDYVDQIQELKSSCNYSSAMTFMKLLCRTCFDRMTS